MNHPAAPRRYDRNSRMKIVALGYIVRGPIGGMAWHHLQYVLGLHRLGHEVLFIEDSGDEPACYDPTCHQVGVDPTYGLQFADDAFSRLGLGERWAYFDAHHSQWLGPASAGSEAFIRESDIVLNVSLVNPLRGALADIPIRVALDTDPLFTQIRNLQESDRHLLTAQHNRFFTFGELIPGGGSLVPDDGFAWQATRQPIVLDCWPVRPPNLDAPLTTVMQWDSYRTQQHNSIEYGMKSTSFKPMMHLPQHVNAHLEIALGSANAPRDLLTRQGWHLRDPLQITRTPWSYQQYIRDSLGEFSIAKHGYVVAQTGWFSERSAAYLASGRPVILQDTGFSRFLPTGSGLLPFRDASTAETAIELLLTDPIAQHKQARGLAEEYFASTQVLNHLLEQSWTGIF